jgi:hypothetical protein
MIEMQHNEHDNLQECFPPPAFILSNIPAFTFEHKAASGSATGLNPSHQVFYYRKTKTKQK